MIQRIQTVYFFFAALFASTAFYLPLFRVVTSGATSPQITEFTAANTAETGTPVAIAFALATLLPLLALLLYKNRPLQIRIGRLAVLIVTAALALAVMAYGAHTPSMESVELIAAIGMFIPIGSIVFLILAIRAVKKDEALVRSADRIR